MKRPKKHAKPAGRYLAPLASPMGNSTHLLIWTEPNSPHPAGGRSLSATAMHVDKRGAAISPLWVAADKRETIADHMSHEWPRKGVATIWLPGGFEDFVASGLAQLADKGQLTFRYLNLTPEKVLLRGSLWGRAVIVTSLSAWTGGSWDAWKGGSDKTGRDLYEQSIRAVANVSVATGCVRVCPSAGEAGSQVWRAWLGPRIKTAPDRSKNAPNASGREISDIVAPSPYRPGRVRQHERHAVYGMVRRFLRRGWVQGPIHHVDIRQAYLAALCCTRIPAIYSYSLPECSREALASHLQSHFATALVRLGNSPVPYPVRRNGQILWCTGSFWTWLCGEELYTASRLNHIAEVKTSHWWTFAKMPASAALSAMALGDVIEKTQGGMERRAWRSVYCQLVGRFAAWRYHWVDSHAYSGLGHWAAWSGWREDDGSTQRYRTVAGRTQALVAREENTWSFPLIFGAVTSTVRMMTLRAALLAGEKGVIAIDCDSLWLDSAGWESLRAAIDDNPQSLPEIAEKAVYDAVEIMDDNRAVVFRDGKVYARVPGLPGDIPCDEDGVVTWRRQAGLADVTGIPDLGSIGGGKRKARRPTLNREKEATAARLPLAMPLDDPLLHDSLISAYLEPRKGVVDGQH